MPGLSFQGQLPIEKEIRQVFSLFPPRFTRGPLIVTAKARPFLDGHLSYYSQVRQEIWIDPSAPVSEWLHQYGHYVYRSYLTKSEQAQWRQSWKDHPRELPTDRARENSEEGFAECWAFYFQPLSFWGKLVSVVIGPLLHPVLAADLERYFHEQER